MLIIYFLFHPPRVRNVVSAPRVKLLFLAFTLIRELPFDPAGHGVEGLRKLLQFGTSLNNAFRGKISASDLAEDKSRL
jgi:hypothetical protein